MRTTVLNFFCDSANGAYGVAHENAIDNETPFNAFWHPKGIFHDVWEHYFETYHPYFKGYYSFNISGEVAAMGHFYYYANTLGLSNIAYCMDSIFGNQYVASTRRIINVTNSDMREAIDSGSCKYGSELACAVPYQKPVPQIDNLVLQHWDAIKDQDVETEDKWEKEGAIIFKKSISLSKLQRLYRWGYRQASELAHNNSDNVATLEDFYTAFEKITKEDAEELSKKYKGIEFKINGGEHIEWDAHFIKHDGTKKNYSHFY